MGIFNGNNDATSTTSGGPDVTLSGLCLSAPSTPASTPITGSLTFHDLMLIIGGACTAFTGLATIFFILWHLIRARNPREQAIYLRIGIVPIWFAGLSLISIFSYHVSEYLLQVPKVWEAIAVCGIWELFVLWMNDDDGKDHSHDRIHLDVTAPNFTPANNRAAAIRIYQYPVIIVIRVLLSFYTASQCSTKKSHKRLDGVLQAADTISTLIAVLTILRTWKQNKTHLAKYRPMLKLTALKGIVGITVLESLAFYVIKQVPSIDGGSDKVSTADIEQGLYNFIVCCIMPIFMVLLLCSFTPGLFKDQPRKSNKVTLMFKTIIRFFNLFDILFYIIMMFCTVLNVITRGSFKAGPVVSGAERIGGKHFEMDSSDEDEGWNQPNYGQFQGRPAQQGFQQARYQPPNYPPRAPAQMATRPAYPNGSQRPAY